MNYTNYINKLSTQTKKAIEDTFSLNEELQKYKIFFNLFPKYNTNSIGYKVKYIFQMDNENSTPIDIPALQSIITYIVENYILVNDMTYFQYHFFKNQNYLCLSIFNKNKNYLETISKNLIDYINNFIDDLSIFIRSKFLDKNIPLKTKVKVIHKDHPILIDVICNTIKEKKLLSKTDEFINSVIKILQQNDITILKDAEIKLETLKSEEYPVIYLTENNVKIQPPPKKQKIETPEDTDEDITDDSYKEHEKIKNNKKQKPLSIFNQVEYVNDNIKQLFWHTLDSKKSINYSDLKHSIIFVLLLAIIINTIPNFLNKILNFTKSNQVIDSILDLATEDLTTTMTKTQSNLTNYKKSFSQLETIPEMNNEVNEPFTPFEPSEPSDNINVITRNIIKKFNENENTNDDLKSIENRLKNILEETDTKT